MKQTKLSISAAFLSGLIVVQPLPSLNAQNLSAEEERLAEIVSRDSEVAISFLERVVNINSGTMNHEGIREVGRIFRAELDALGLETEWIPQDSVDRAGHLFAYSRGGTGPTILLIGHLDTVFEKDSPFQRFERTADSLIGPGTEDMKGGNVNILFALKALGEIGVLDRINVIVAFPGDEERPGQPLSISRRDLVQAGRESDIALGFEASVPGINHATVARRGASGWRLEVTGVRAHSSGVFSEEVGAGAIFEAARILNDFYREVRGEEYLTFNPGHILGGTVVEHDPAQDRGSAFGKTNVVAERAVVTGGLRFISEDQKGRARSRMREIVGRNLPETSARITFWDSYPAMPPTDGNYQLLAVLDRVSRDLGYGPVEATDPGQRGAADISFVAANTKGLAGLGPVGSGGHTTEERILTVSLEQATARAALLIYRLARGQNRVSR